MNKKKLQDRPRDLRQQLEFVDGRIAVGALFSSMSIISTDRSSLQSLMSSNSLQQGSYYYIEDALATQVATYPIIAETTQGVLVLATSASTISGDGYWLRNTFLTSFASFMITSMGGNDTIDSISCSSFGNQLTSPIQFDTNPQTTAGLVIDNINNNLKSSTTAYGVKGMTTIPGKSVTEGVAVILIGKEANDTLNGESLTIDVTEDGGSISTGINYKKDFVGGQLPFLHCYSCGYDIDEDDLTYVYDEVRDFRLGNVTSGNEKTGAVYTFPYESTLVKYNNTSINELVWRNNYFSKEINIQDLQAEDGKIEIRDNLSSGLVNLHRIEAERNGVFRLISVIWHPSNPNLAGDELKLTSNHVADGAVNMTNLTMLDTTAVQNFRYFQNTNTKGTIRLGELYMTGNSIVNYNGNSYSAGQNSSSAEHLDFRFNLMAGDNQYAMLNCFITNGTTITWNNNDTSATTTGGIGIRLFSCNVANTIMTYDNIAIANSHVYSGCDFNTAKGLVYSGTYGARSWTGVRINNNKFDVVITKTGLTGAAGNGATGDITLLSGLPIGFYPTRRDLQTANLASSGSIAELSLGITVDDTTVLMPATVITSLNQIDVEGSTNLPNLGNSVETTDNRNVIASVTVENITAGSIELTLEGTISTI